MSNVRVFGFIAAALALGTMYELIKRQNIKEKYAALWLFAGCGIAVVAIYPHLIDLVADLTGIKAGPNVLLLVGGLLLTLVCVQLSVEISRMADRERALAEELGLLRLQLERVQDQATPRDERQGR